MRLTKTIRDAWVNSILQNIPKVNYGPEAKGLMMEIIPSKYPDFVNKVISDTSEEGVKRAKMFLKEESLYNLQPLNKYLVKHGLPPGKDLKFTSWTNLFGNDSTVTYYGSNNTNLYSSTNFEYWWAPKLETDEWERIVAVFKKQFEHTDKVSRLRRDLMTLANGCNTRQQLVEAAPEFEKYLPIVANTPIDRSRSLAVVNPAGLARELGWKP